MKKLIAITILTLTITGCGQPQTMEEKYPSFILTKSGFQPKITFKENIINIHQQAQTSKARHRRACIEPELFSFHPNAYYNMPSGYQIDWVNCDHFGNPYWIEGNEYYTFTIFRELTTQKYFMNYHGSMLPLIVID
jgi:hypothetical protein